MTSAPPDAPASAILTVWGASGSAPSAGPQRARYGGETVCFGLLPEDAPGERPTLLVDLGSGAREAGRAIEARSRAAGVPARVHVLLSHLHLDHVWGAPFFAPFYARGARVDLHAGLFETAEDFSAALGTLVAPPFFPIEPLRYGAAFFHVFRPGADFEAAGFRVRALMLNHPGGCIGFRIEGAGWSAAILGDHEHGDPQADANAAELARDVDLMIYDAAYEDDEYPAYQGWGHSTWERGLELGEAAGARRILLHHHQPDRVDEALDRIEARVKAACPRACLARQGMRWRLSPAGAELLA